MITLVGRKAVVPPGDWQGFVDETPWMTAALPDFLYPDTRGERPNDLDRRLQFAAALRRIAIRDPAVHRLAVEVWHLMKPFSAFQDPERARRVAEEMAQAWAKDWQREKKRRCSRCRTAQVGRAVRRDIGEETGHRQRRLRGVNMGHQILAIGNGGA